MKLTLTFVFILVFFQTNPAQRSAAARRANPSELGKAVVIDERLAVLRTGPGFYTRTLQRMRRGRVVTVISSGAADGATFYKISVQPKTVGWVQLEALVRIAGNGNDDTRLARLIYASTGFDQIERASIFLENFPRSSLRPSILLLFGDLIEEAALELSKNAGRRLETRQMAASGAPLHSFYLNYSGLDRYSRLGIEFLFDAATKRLHYEGEAWRELVNKFPASAEAGEARKRLKSENQTSLSIKNRISDVRHFKFQTNI